MSAPAAAGSSTPQPAPRRKVRASEHERRRAGGEASTAHVGDGVDPRLLFDADDLSRVRAGTLTRIVECLADKTARFPAGTHRAALRDDVASLFLSYPAFGIEPETLFAAIAARYTSAPAAPPANDEANSVDSSARAAVDLRYKKRAGAVALLERWAAVAPLDFFVPDKAVVVATAPAVVPPLNAVPVAALDDSDQGGARRPSALLMISPRDNDASSDDDEEESSAVSALSDDGEEEEEVERGKATRVDEKPLSPEAAAARSRKLSLRKGLSSQPLTLGTARALRPDVLAFFRSAEHGRFAKQLAAVETRLRNALEPDSVQSRDITAIDRLLDGAADVAASGATSPPSAAAAMAALAATAPAPTRSADEELLAIEPAALADVLNTLEHSLLAAIAEAPRQLLQQAWNSADKATVAPDVVRYIAWFNLASRWVAVEIVKPAQPDVRARIIAHFIRVAAAAREQQNYNAVFEVVAALHSAAISGMKASWALVGDADRAAFDALTAFCSSQRNYRAMRDALAVEDDSPRLPYLGVFLTDQTFIDDGNASWIDAADASSPPVPLLNFAKARLSTQLMLSLRRWLRNVRPRAPRVLRHQVLAMIGGARSWDDGKLRQLSRLREPRTTGSGGGGAAAAVAAVAVQPMGERVNVSTDRIELSPHEWTLLSVHSTTQRYGAGETIVRDGEATSALFVVVSGTCVVTLAVRDAGPTPDRRRSSAAALADDPNHKGFVVAALERKIERKASDCADQLAADGGVVVKTISIMQLAAGDMFNLGGFIDTSAEPQRSWKTVVAFSACEVRRLDRDYVHAVIADMPDIAMSLFKNIALRLTDLHEALVAACSVANSATEHDNDDEEEAVLSPAARRLAERSATMSASSGSGSGSGGRGGGKEVEDFLRTSVTRNTPPPAVPEVHDREFEAEFKLGRDQAPLEQAAYLLKRRGVWTRAHVIVTSHYVCLRSRIFGVTQRESVSLFDVSEVVSTVRGDLVVRGTQRNKKKPKVWELRPVPASDGGRDLGGLIHSLWEALPKVTGSHQRRLLAQLAAHGVGKPPGAPTPAAAPASAAPLSNSGPPRKTPLKKTTSLRTSSMPESPTGERRNKSRLPLALLSTVIETDDAEEADESPRPSVAVVAEDAERVKLAESLQQEELTRERNRRRRQRDVVVSTSKRKAVAGVDLHDAKPSSLPGSASTSPRGQLTSSGSMRENNQLAVESASPRGWRPRSATMSSLLLEAGVPALSDMASEAPCELTESDWDLLLDSAKVLKFRRNEVVIAQGESYQRVYQVISGNLMLVREMPDDRLAIWSRLHSGQSFGESSFLTGTPATASVIAVDDVELVMIEGAFVQLLFGVRAGLAGRFFNFLARALAERVTSSVHLLNRIIVAGSGASGYRLSADAVSAVRAAMDKVARQRSADKADDDDDDDDDYDEDDAGQLEKRASRRFT